MISAWVLRWRTLSEIMLDHGVDLWSNAILYMFLRKGTPFSPTPPILHATNTPVAANQETFLSYLPVHHSLFRMGILRWAVATACFAWTASAAIHDEPLIRPGTILSRQDLAIMKRQNISTESPSYNCHDNCGELYIVHSLSSFCTFAKQKRPPSPFVVSQARRSSRSKTAAAAPSTFATTPPSPPTTTTACSAPAPITRTSGCTTALSSTRRRLPVAILRRPSPERKMALARP